MSKGRLLFCAVASASIVLAAIACSSSDDSAAGNDGGPGGGDGGEGGLNGDSGPGPGGDGGDPSFDDFEDPGGCGGWQGDNANVAWMPGGAHGSQGSCQVCMTDAGGVMFKLVTIPAPGTYQLDALLELPDGGGDAGTWTATLAFANSNGSAAGNATNSGALKGTFTAIPSLKGTTTTGERVTASIGATADCFLVDDVRLSKK